MSTTARDVAVTVLHRVADQAAYASAALAAELSRAKLDPRDAGLATEIVYGSLRCLPELDAAIKKRLSDPKRELDGWIRAVLRAATYELLHLERVPPHASVSEAVRIATGKRGKAVGGFVNAILRGVSKERPESPAPPTRLVVPGWVTENIHASLGEERAATFLDGRRLPPPVGLRVILSRTTRQAVRDRILESLPGAELEDGILPETLLLRHGADPATLPGYAEGDFTVQEQGAQLVAAACGVAANHRVADICAGRGGKTTRFVADVGPGGSVVAVDLDERKLENIPKECARLHLPEGIAETHAVDFSVGTGGLEEEGAFDVVVCDAPCTGLGTVHRRPELLMRLTEKDPMRMSALQRSILHHASALVKPGGRLVFAVCSPTRAEGVLVAETFEAGHPAFARHACALPEVPADADLGLRVGPWNGDADAYQAFAWVRSFA